MLICINKASSVFDAIEKIAATSSKLEKEALIKQAGTSSAMFMKVCKAAYDPFVTYGIARIPNLPPSAPGANTLDEPYWWEVLNDLASRKLSGDAAREAVVKALCFLDNASSQLFRRIILKDLRAGFTDGTINRVFKGTIPEFPYMRCSLPDKSDMPKWTWSDGIISQEKADGMFVNVNRDEVGNVWLTSRQGSPIPLDKLKTLEWALQQALLTGTQSHGEMTIYRGGVLLPREEGNGMLNSIIQGGELDEGCTVRLDLWDQIPLSVVQPKGKYTTPYKERLQHLIKQLGTPEAMHPTVRSHVGLVPTRIVKSKEAAFAHYRELLSKGKEGTICKSPTAIWKDGTSKEQVKLKLEVDLDLVVTKVIPGTPGTKNEGRPGSLECQTSCGDLVVNVTVKNEAMRDQVESNPDQWIGGIMVVRANQIMEPGDSSEFYSLFLPRFVEAQVRTDKTTADSLDRVRSIFANAIGATE